MASVFQGFQSALTQLAAASKAQTGLFNSLKKDLILQLHSEQEEEETGMHGTPNLFHLNVNQLLH